MTRPVRKSFTAVLEPDLTRLRWTIARVPFDVAKAWPVQRGLRVRGEIEGFSFRTSLFPDPRGEGHTLLVNKRRQAAAKAKVGSKVRIGLEPDMEERAAKVPPELALALKEDRRLPKMFDGLSYSMRKAFGDWVNQAKSAEARRGRGERMAERLLLALEGEKELPPILQGSICSPAVGAKRWEAMTPVQRRNHLLGIFYYQSAEARERRAAKAVEEAARVATRGTSA